MPGKKLDDERPSDCGLAFGFTSTTPGFPADDLGESDPIEVFATRYMQEPWRFPDKHIELASLSVAMIVRNDETNIARSLESVKDIANEIIVVDTGSSDHTVEIARSHGAKVVFHPWNNSWSEAGNICLENATCDWVLFLDADDELIAEDVSRLAQLIQDIDHSGFYLGEIYYVGEQEEDGAVSSLSFRLWRNKSEYRFADADQEQLKASARLNNPRVGVAEVRINNFGYLNKPNTNKVQRDLRILMGERDDGSGDFSLRIKVGVDYLAQGDFKRALESYKRAFANLSGSDIQNAARLANNMSLCLKSLGRHRQALKLLRDAQDAYPEYVDLFYMEGLVHFEERDYESATTCFETCLTMGSHRRLYYSHSGVGSYMAAYMAARTCLALGNEAKSLCYYEKALALNAGYGRAAYDLGLLLLRKDGPENVRQILESQVDLNSEVVLSSLSLLFSQTGYYDISLIYVEQLAEKGSAPSQTALLKGECLFNLGYFKEAIAEFDKVAISSQHYSAACANKSVCYMLIGDSKRAIEAIDLIKSIKEFALVHAIYRSVASLSKGRVSSISLDVAQKDSALQIVADLMGKLLELKNLDVFEKAVALLDELGLSPGESSLFLGKIYYDAGYNEIAVEELIHAYESGSADGESFYILGSTAFDNEFFEEAKTFFFEALHRGVEELGLFVLLGRTLIKQGEIGLAAEVFEAGAGKYPNAPLIAELRQHI